MLIKFSRIKLVLFFFVVFATSILGQQTAFAQEARFTVASGGREIVASGPYAEQFFSGSNFAESGVSKSYYNTANKTITFVRERENFYVTHVTTFFNNGGTQGCYPAINTRVTSNGDGTSSLNGTVSGRLIVPGEGTIQNPDKTDQDCANEVRAQSDLGSDLQIIGAIGDIATNEDSLNGINIISCSTADGGAIYNRCLQVRNQQITSALNNVSCSTQSVAAIERCEQLRSETNTIISCLRQSASRTLAECRARVTADNILAGDVSKITAQTTDSEIEAICNIIADRVQQARCEELAKTERDRLVAATPEDTTSCGVDGIGWIICPALTFMAGLTDAAFGILTQFLVVDPRLLSTTGDSNGTYLFWQAMRNFANVAFIVVFLIIIFSQLTSTGVSNYGVKKTLPRLILSAILVNISFFLCQIAVDLSNVAGVSLYNGISSIPVGGGSGDASGNALGWAILIPTILAGGAIAALAISVPVLIAALLAIAVLLLILMGRFALIVILTGLAPLAFVAFLLPNTENLFKKWLKLFSSMLLLYPIVGVVFGASYVASRIIANAGGEIENGFLQITALAVAALPLLAIPSLLKGSMSAAGAVGAKLNSMSSKANARIGSKSKETSMLGAANRSFQQGSARRRTRFQGRMARIIPGQTGRRMRAAGEAAGIQGENEDLKIEQQSLQNTLDSKKAMDPNFNTDAFLEARAQDDTLSESQRGAAMHQLATTGRDASIRRLQRSVTDKKGRESLQRAVSAGGGALAAKAPDLVKGPEAAFGSMNGADLAGLSADTGRAYMAHLEQLHTRATMPGALPEDIAKRDKAFTAFNSAVEDITRDPTLQGKFQGDTGRKIQETFTTSSPAFQNYANGVGAASAPLYGIGGIDAQGKIR